MDTTNKDDSDSDISKSQVLAPFNTVESSANEFIESIEPLVVKNDIKFSSKLREVNRQYERNNNSNIDNGIYVKSMTLKQPIKSANVKSRATLNQINNKVLEQMLKMGFEKDFIQNSLNRNLHNCATTCYYLLCED